MRLQRVQKPFDNPDYIFELKHDGFRYIEDRTCKLVSRNQGDMTHYLTRDSTDRETKDLMH
jgi:ATP-dependent DNA ligase